YDLATSENKNHIKDMEGRINTLLENPEQLEQRVQKSIKNEQTPVDDFDRVLLKKIYALIERSEKQGIQLVFILSPRNIDTETYKVSTQIPQEHFLDLSSASRFPELYSLENSFDLGHLNDQGTAFYTKLLVEEYVARNKK
ncbi:MAG: hypothetical protein KDC91_11215, partial [Flavobacteriaceae bacterium]|nr:hypothetical protein [Flavobacteriaceae bacterium]